jgi:hypothetical protein
MRCTRRSQRTQACCGQRELWGPLSVYARVCVYMCELARVCTDHVRRWAAWVVGVLAKHSLGVFACVLTGYLARC